MNTLSTIGSMLLFLVYPIPAVAGIAWSIVAIDRRKIGLSELFTVVEYCFLLISFYTWLVPLIDQTLQIWGCPYSAFD
jgi:hypothetical protein